MKVLEKKILDYCEKMLQSSGISKKNICILLRSVHFALPIINGLILLLAPYFLFKAVLILKICIFSLFIIFDGCILSRLEQRFSELDDKYTIIDPFLELYKIPLNNENRKKYSLYIWGSCFILTYLIYYFRFSNTNI